MPAHARRLRLCFLRVQFVERTTAHMFRTWLQEHSNSAKSEKCLYVRWCPELTLARQEINGRFPCIFHVQLYYHTKPNQSATEG
ncbi:hypothetical protein C8R47DRAFT_1110506 [Mycena vitilis]|nr:hypothetical protein C8R47DRAFT_1110506 [Mycena vitilis]